MTPEQTNLWLEIQHRQMVALERLADAVERLAPTSTAAPNLTSPLESFASFDWESIGAIDLSENPKSKLFKALRQNFDILVKTQLQGVDMVSNSLEAKISTPSY